MEDFNTIRFSSEKNKGNMSTDIAMEEFHDYLFNLELAGMPFIGPMFTWMNRRAVGHVPECCERIFKPGVI